MQLKIYGERNCGTNYLEYLVKNNLEVDLLKFHPGPWSILLLKSIPYDFVQDLLWCRDRKKTLGWKHGCAPVKLIESCATKDLIILTITKNPYAFLYSLFKNTYHIKGEKPAEFSTFIRQQWTTRKRDLCSDKFLASPMLLWTIKNQSYIDLKNTTDNLVINISYEHLIENPKRCICQIAEMAKIKLINEDHFQNLEHSTNDSELTYADYKKFYLEERWREAYDTNDLTYINQFLEDEIMDLFEYKKIDDVG